MHWLSTVTQRIRLPPPPNAETLLLTSLRSGQAHDFNGTRYLRSEERMRQSRGSWKERQQLPVGPLGQWQLEVNARRRLVVCFYSISYFSTSMLTTTADSSSATTTMNMSCMISGHRIARLHLPRRTFVRSLHDGGRREPRTRST